MVVYWTGFWNYARYMTLLSFNNKMVEGQGSITVKQNYETKLKLQER